MPNVSYTLNYDSMSIWYTTSQRIAAGDELVICYGREEDMWWNDRSGEKECSTFDTLHEDELLKCFGAVIEGAEDG